MHQELPNACLFCISGEHRHRPSSTARIITMNPEYDMQCDLPGMLHESQAHGRAVIELPGTPVRQERKDTLQRAFDAFATGPDDGRPVSKHQVPPPPLPPSNIDPLLEDDALLSFLIEDELGTSPESAHTWRLEQPNLQPGSSSVSWGSTPPVSKDATTMSTATAPTSLQLQGAPSHITGAHTEPNSLHMDTLETAVTWKDHTAPVYLQCVQAQAALGPDQGPLQRVARSSPQRSAQLSAHHSSATRARRSWRLTSVGSRTCSTTMVATHHGTIPSCFVACVCLPFHLSVNGFASFRLSVCLQANRWTSRRLRMIAQRV